MSELPQADRFYDDQDGIRFCRIASGDCRGLPVLFVSLKPPFDVLMERVAQRKMDKKSPHRRNLRAPRV